MALHSDQNVKKARRLTYRQKVIEIYPLAQLGYGNFISFRHQVGGISRYAYFEQVVLSDGCKTPREAWKDAWKNVQKEMIRKLED